MSRLSLSLSLHPNQDRVPVPSKSEKVRKLISTHYLGTRSSINDRAQTPRFPHLSVDFSPGVNTAHETDPWTGFVDGHRERKKVEEGKCAPNRRLLLVPFRGLGQQTHTFSYICGSIKIRIVVESLMVGLGERVVGGQLLYCCSLGDP